MASQAKRKDFESFSDPNFNVRLWLNQTLAQAPSTVPSAPGTAPQQTAQMAQIIAADQYATGLLGDLQIHTSDLGQQLEHSIGQALARLPRTAAEISRMAQDASVISKQLNGIRTVVDPIIGPALIGKHHVEGQRTSADGGSDETAPKPPKPDKDIEQLQKSKEKLLWCRTVLRTAQTLSQDISSIDKGLKALADPTLKSQATPAQQVNNGGVDSEGAPATAASNSNSGGIADIELLATSIRRLNVSLGTIKAVDPTFGSAYETKIRDFERQLQLSVERECLEIIKSRKLCVPTTMSSADVLKTAGDLAVATPLIKDSPMSVTSPTNDTAPVPSTKVIWENSASETAQRTRATRLFAILRTIQRDGHAVEALIQTSVDRLVQFFKNSITPAIATASSALSQPSTAPSTIAHSSSKPPALPPLITSATAAPATPQNVLRLFYRYLGAQVGHDAAYLWALSDLHAEDSSSSQQGSNTPSAMGSNIVKASPQTPAGGAGMIKAGVANEGIEVTINDALAAVMQRTLEAIARPLRDLLTAPDITPGNAALSSAATIEALNNCLVQSLQGTRDAEIESEAVLRMIVSQHLVAITSAATNPKGGSEQQQLVRTGTPHHPHSALKHVDPTELSLRLRKVLPRAMHSTVGRIVFAPFVETFVLREKKYLQLLASSAQQPTTADSQKTYPQIASASNTIRALEAILRRCSAFFPADTANPCLNAWSRQTATALQQLQDAISADIGQQNQQQQSGGAPLIQKLLTGATSTEAIKAHLLDTQRACFASYIGGSSAGPTTANGGIDADILQSCLKMAELEVSKAITTAQQGLKRMLALPIERAIAGKYRTLAEWHTGGAVNATGGPAAGAQKRSFTAGLAGPCDLIRASGDLVMEVPVSLESLGVADDDRAALFKAIVVESLRMILVEIASGLGVAPQPNATQPNAKLSLKPFPSRLLSLPTERAIAQLSADLEYLANIVDYCGMEAGGEASEKYCVDEAEAKFDGPLEYWTSEDGARCIAEYHKKLVYLLSSSAPASKSGQQHQSQGGPEDLVTLFKDSEAATPYSVFKRLQLHLAALHLGVVEGKPITVPVQMVM